MEREEEYRILINRFSRYLEEDIRCIAVGSYVAHQGKTDLVMNLGKRLAKLGYKTLLMDFNMYSPMLSRLIPHEKSEGLIEAIEILKKRGDESVVSEFAQATADENLFVYTRGGYLSKPYKEHISESNISKLIKVLRKEYKFILIEAPDLRYLSFSEVCLQSSDGYLLVVKADSIYYKQVIELKKKTERLEAVNLGAVFMG